MDHELSPDRLAKTLEHLCRHWAEKQGCSRSNFISPAPHALTIALSREAGAQGTAVGQLQAFEALMSVPYASEGAYVHRLVKTVLALGSHGECVIVGRGSAFILPAENTLRVRLIAPLKDRVASISRRLGVPEEKATRQLEMLDQERNTFVQDHFSKDPVDPQHYDLILNSARFGVVGCAELIVDALDAVQAYTTQRTQAAVASN